MSPEAGSHPLMWLWSGSGPEGRVAPRRGRHIRDHKAGSFACPHPRTAGHIVHRRVGPLWTECGETVSVRAWTDGRRWLTDTGCSVRRRPAGFTARDLRQLVRSDAVVRLDRGWYGLTEALSSDPDSPWERRRRQHALRAGQSFVVTKAPSWLAITPGSWCPACRSLPPTCDRCTPPGSMQASSAAAPVSRSMNEATACRLSTASSTCDRPSWGTGRCNGQMAALVAADAALHRHLLTVDDLASSADHVVGPASVRCRRVVGLADGRAGVARGDPTSGGVALDGAGGDSAVSH